MSAPASAAGWRRGRITAGGWRPIHALGVALGLAAGCRPAEEWATLTFDYRRVECDRMCVGTQIIRVSEEYWGGWAPTADMAFFFSYAGMELYSSTSDFNGMEGLVRDPLWGIGDPACRGVISEDLWWELPPCDPPLPVYPSDDACFAGAFGD